MMKVQAPVSLLFIMFFLADAVAQESACNCRDIPVPAGASEALQTAIGGHTLADNSSLQKAPTNEAQWLENIAENDAWMAAPVSPLLDVVSVHVVKDEIAGVKVHRVTPEAVTAENKGRLFLYIHGGAYIYGAGDAGIFEAILIADRIEIPVISVDYRMPPRHPFPAALDDVVDVYRDLVESRSASSIIIGGTSAGGGLSLAVVHRLKELGASVPGATYLGTPWADLTKTGDTLYTNEGLDRVIPTYDGFVGAAARLYAGSHDMTDPLISPVYGEFTGFPPAILASGTRDLLLSDTARTHRKLRKAGVTADLHVYEGMSHAGYLVSPSTPESLDMYNEIAAFIDRYLD